MVKMIRPAGIPRCIRRMAFSITVLFPAVCCGQNPLQVELSTIAEGTADWDWMQARTAYVPLNPRQWLTTMSRTSKVGSHGYHDVYVSISADAGLTWSRPDVIPSLQRSKQDDGNDVVAGDLWPQWHPMTGKILITGKTFSFEVGTRENTLREQVAYGVIDTTTGRCGPLRTVDIPDVDHAGRPIIAPNAGCHQRVDLPDGEILLPIRYQSSAQHRVYTTIVARCRFDGETLSYVEHGTEHTITSGRGLYEPSVARFGGRFFLTMRADDGAFVTRSTDGLRYAAHRPWMFDDGEPLGSENTQQHWIALAGRLYLVYTRRGANNDHIFRHRAPLFIAQVDPDRLVVLRQTELIVVPQNHATLGNSGICRISDVESWLTVAEGRVSDGERRGEVNNVILAKITQQ